jgi:hypothetical protein
MKRERLIFRRDAPKLSHIVAKKVDAGDADTLQLDYRRHVDLTRE